MKTGIIICARWHSTRLPGKMLALIGAKPLLQHVVDQCRKSCADTVIIATTPISTPIIEYCIKAGIPISIASVPDDDILGRLYQAATEQDIDVVVRVWGDSPLIEPDVINRMVHFWEEGQFDYAYNKGWPTGWTVAVLPFSTLYQLNRTLVSEQAREWLHVFFTDSDYRIGVLENEVDESKERMVVDDMKDLERIRVIYEGRKGDNQS